MKARLQITYGHVSLFADRFRLDCFDDMNRFYVGLASGVGEDVQSPVIIDLPKKDRAAYERAVAAFNMILDQHELSTRRSKPQPAEVLHAS